MAKMVAIRSGAVQIGGGGQCLRGGFGGTTTSWRQPIRFCSFSTQAKDITAAGFKLLKMKQTIK